jgi:hypothetical protein
MHLNLLLTGKRKLLILGVAGILVFAVLLITLRSFMHKEPTMEETRLQHIDYLVKVVEAYKDRNGAYPQPTVRRETSEGMKHVWGYEPEIPALASCTITVAEDGAPVAEEAHCGGNVYDLEGNLLGWKGTLTAESALNSIEAAHRDGVRLSKPVSDLSANIPADPAYANLPAFTSAGFGEYVYAVRAPEDSAQGKGGTEYQIAVTVLDPESGIKRTHIRGNYFVKSSDRERLPASMIGPGLLYDQYNNPVEGQTEVLHVLLESQREGFPNPVLGHGEEILQKLSLGRRAGRLLQSIDDRIAIVSLLEQGEASEAFSTALGTVRSNTEIMLSDLEPGEEQRNGGLDLSVLEARITDSAANLSEATKTFLAEKGKEVEAVLRLEVDQRGTVEKILRDALESAEDAEESVLLARDEVLKYLDGEGIEEQSRSRASRKLQSALDAVPDLSGLFTDAGLPFPHPFLPEHVSEKMKELADAEEGVDMADGEDEEEVAEADEEDAEAPDVALEPAVMLSTLTAELTVLFSELDTLLTDIQDQLDNAAIPSEEVDDSLRKLAHALDSENERIGILFDSFASEESAAAFLSHYLLLTLGEEENVAPAIARLAELSMQKGDFAPLLFMPTLLDLVILEKSAGIPDIEAYDDALQAEYKGVPYPLP